MPEIDLTHLQHWLEEQFKRMDQRFAYVDQRFDHIERRLLSMNGTLNDIYSQQVTMGDLRAVHTRLIDHEERLSRLEASNPT